MYTVNMASGCVYEDASFVSLDDLGNITILLDKDNDLEEEIAHLLNKLFLFSSLKKNTSNQALNILKTSIIIRGHFERFQVPMFSSKATVWFGLKAHFSQLIKSQ